MAEASVYDLFQAQARKTPSAVAAIWAEESRTYAELDRMVSDLAGRLVCSGVTPEARVALHLPRSMDMLVACLAVWKVGATYAPLDLASPPARLQEVVDQCGPAAILYASALSTPPDLQTSAEHVDLSRPWLREDAETSTPDGRRGAAYILFTSGSTGVPKGVIVDHAALSGLLRGVRDRIGFEATDVFAATSSLTFDIAALELFLPLICGAAVRLLPEGLARDAVRLRDALEPGAATVVQGTPSMWRALLKAEWRGGVKLAIAGGEVLDADLARRLVACAGAVWNGYGPTEATIYTTLHKVVAADLDRGEIPIGAPLSGVVVHVVDERGASVEPEVAGEILIGGPGLARGYLNRPDLDLDRFRSYPGLADRLYRTGDIGYQRPDGALMFLRRADSQIKFRGVRIEPGEIETRLLATPGVNQAAVALRTDDQGRKLLAAYLVPRRAGDVLSDAQVRASLREWLPEAMIPSAFFWMEALPLTASGKVDRSALGATAPAPRPPLPAVGAEPPEQVIGRLWGQALGRAPLAPDEDFFGAGGDSLAALNAIFLTAPIAGRDLSVTDLIEHPTPGEFAAYLSASPQGGDLDRQIVDAAVEGRTP
ncbi:MAG: non-ribosomal peptide synthetase [Caulobacter sp.]